MIRLKGRGPQDTAGSRQERHEHILDILARNRVESQEELQELLLAEGVASTQSTLSRDLRQMGVVKGMDGYHVPTHEPVGPDRLPALADAVRRHLLSVDWGGNLVVLKVASNDDAQRIARRIERSRLHQAVAALVCQESVLVVARTQAYAREMAHRFTTRSRRR